jgi:hypothetical protein
LLWTRESESKEESDLLWTRESKSKEESDLLWTRESESKGGSDLLWTGESDRARVQGGESDLVRHLLRLDLLGQARPVAEKGVVLMARKRAKGALRRSLITNLTNNH